MRRSCFDFDKDVPYAWVAIMIHRRAWFAPLLVTVSVGRMAMAQPSGEPPPPPLPAPAPPVYNPPAPPPYTGPPINRGPAYTGTGDIPYFHDRFYLRVSLGGGTMGSSGTFDPDNGETFTTRGGNFAFDLAIGGTPAPGFVVGGRYTFLESFKPHFTLTQPGTRTLEGDSTVNEVFGLFGVFVDWFPDPRGGFHAGATLGVAFLSVEDPQDDVQNSVTERGGGGALHLGYDFWVSEQWSLGVLGQFTAGRVSGDFAGGTTERDTVTSFSVMFTALYH